MKRYKEIDCAAEVQQKLPNGRKMEIGFPLSLLPDPSDLLHFHYCLVVLKS